MRWKAILAAVAIVVMAAGVASSKTQTVSRKATKQYGGSTGDSVNTLADTSAAIFVPQNVKNWYYTVQSDSSTRTTLQVAVDANAADSVAWKTVEYDSIATGDDVWVGPRHQNVLQDTTGSFFNVQEVVGSGGFGFLYAGQKIRVIQDAISAPADSATQRANVWFFFRIED